MDTHAPPAGRSAPRPRNPRSWPAGGRGARTGGRGKQSRWRVARPWRLCLGVLAAVVLVVAGLLALRLVRSGALPGLEVGGLAVGGLDEAALLTGLEALAQDRAAVEVIAEREGETLARSLVDIGYAIDVDATAAAALARGRQRNPLLAAADQLRASVGGFAIDPVVVTDAAAVDAWAAEVTAALARPPIEGDVRIEGTRVVRVDPAAGEVIDADALTAAAAQALATGTATTVPVTVSPSQATTTRDDVDAAAAAAVQALSAPVELYRGPVSLRFSPEDLAAILDIEPRETDAGTELTLVADGARLEALVPAEQRAALEVAARDARFEAVDGRVEVAPGVAGFRFNRETAAEQLVDVASRGADLRFAELRGDTVPPQVTTAALEALGVRDEIGVFTSEHACCQGRVTNIHRIADLVRGVVLQPGEEFSLNGHVGERTVEAGFVDGGAIESGEFVDVVGGGVSQFATTLFNAAYFAGLELAEHQAHSYYLSRYPEGREATLNWEPPIDLRFVNSSPGPIYLDTRYTDTAITVAIYGTAWVEVESVTGARHGFREPEEDVEENPSLAPGSSRVVQAGSQGFTIDVTRVLRFPDGRVEEEVFTTYYLAEPRIVEVNSATAPAATVPAPDPEPTAAPEPGPEEPEPEPEPAAATPAPTTAPVAEPTTVPAPDAQPTAAPAPS